MARAYAGHWPKGGMFDVYVCEDMEFRRRGYKWKDKKQEVMEKVCEREQQISKQEETRENKRDKSVETEEKKTNTRLQ